VGAFVLRITFSIARRSLQSLLGQSQSGYA
jgi:hypothetical protein